MSEETLTHFNAKGDVHMVDIGAKDITQRVAIATGCIIMQAQTLEKIKQGGFSKGDVLGIARTAGIMGAKKTSELIPLCHPIMITSVAIELLPDTDNNTIQCTATVKCNGKTGVEMEALTAVQISLLTIYDMCKAIDRGMVIADVSVAEKHGGKSGHWQRQKSSTDD